MSNSDYEKILIALPHIIKEVEQSKEENKKVGIDIYKSALRRLDNDGFDTSQIGTRYIAKLVEVFYHEKKLLVRAYKRASLKGYWDLNDKENPHYFSLGVSEEVMTKMREAIIGSTLEENDTDFNEMIYDLADQEIFRYCFYRVDTPDRKLFIDANLKAKKPKRVSYTYCLLKKDEESTD